MQSLQGKKALITGGSRGIGRATALALANEGVAVGLIARSEESLAGISEELSGMGASFAAAAADVADVGEVNKAIRKLSEELGDFDILINNAGIMEKGPFLEISPDQWQKTLNTNVMGIVHVTQTVLPSMIKNNKGDIINISSMAGLKGTEGTSAYSASKFAVVGMSEALMQEVRRNNIRVSTLTPSLIETDLTRGKGGDNRNPDKFTQAEDMAEYIVSILKLEQRTFIKTAAQWGTNPF